MLKYVLEFNEIDKTKLMVVGGKGLNLGELSRIEGISVPKGFCVTTEAYAVTLRENREFHHLMEELSYLKVDDREKISEVSGKIRKVIEEAEMPADVKNEIADRILQFGEHNAYAVRSSATAEDLPTASFAGQQDTYLNIKGREAILKHISKCWASLFTERSVTYRIQNGFDHRKVYLSVVIQQMIFPDASGILFTADPVTSNRKVLSIDASYGLGEALVSGLVNADNYKVREGKITVKKISVKKLEIRGLDDGGTAERIIEASQQNRQTLEDAQILELETIGRRIEKYFGSPQDIEWCFRDGAFFIVQSRPITTLFPVPENDGKNRIYASMGHLQMMTEDIKPLGMSFCRFLSFWFGENLKAAGGRLYLDGTYDLSSPIGKTILITSTGKADILMKNALLNIMKRQDFVKDMPRGKGSINAASGALAWILPAVKNYRRNDETTAPDLIAFNEELIRDMEQQIKKLSGNDLFEFILEDTRNLKTVLTGPQNMSMMVVGGYVSNWITKKTEKWLGEKGAVDTLSKSIPNNVTSEMGLELMDVSDVVRKYPDVLDYFKRAKDESFFDDLALLEGGSEVSKSIKAYLDKYGSRCSGEIDITKARWSEKPTTLISMIQSNIRNFEPNARKARFEQGRKEAAAKEEEIIKRLEQMPGGKQKSKKMKKMISVLRNMGGFREYPKYSFIKRFLIYKEALMKEAEILVEKGVIKEKEDVCYLYFDEFREAVRTGSLDYSIITGRKEDYQVFEKLTPPRVMTSEGEIISGEYNTGNIPDGALVGVPVSAGIIEGRARVVLKMEDANLEEGDILVTSFTDPSWTPLFVSVKGLVTEIGGLMTHGAVITREYGLPAVVGVENATKLITDGQLIRINGTEGYVEFL
ncbi:phosphoenolpyruvate synthase [Sinanaerobacter chloroacetimidivorans]|uniref:Rifampicin phosphotransferase n=1 Tax=Sinanaerobacter chloroacetimidivorans TaxID=2818044 RepID=A0A8J8B2J2_9FIRM|nr:phosphoenolpyruvate synthase [Sinanaerobacter chloroacetimidivorans]MBR0599364.1 phosphoenolpyruvate synthase [Sinanaerobacter chloroacetimidivorans]